MRTDRKQRETDSSKTAREILEGVGGRENIVSVCNCITRLRLEVKRMEVLDEPRIRQAGAAAVLRLPENKIHIVIGTEVLSIAKEFQRLWKAEA